MTARRWLSFTGRSPRIAVYNQRSADLSRRGSRTFAGLILTFLAYNAAPPAARCGGSLGHPNAVIDALCRCIDVSHYRDTGCAGLMGIQSTMSLSVAWVLCDLTAPRS